MKKCIFIYMGKRITKKNTLADFWTNETCKESFSVKRPPFAAIGDKFEFTVENENEVYTSGERGPKKLNKKIGDAVLVKSWVAQEAAAKQQISEMREEKKFAKNQDVFERHVAPLRTMANLCRTHAEKAYFINRVVNELWR